MARLCWLAGVAMALGAPAHAGDVYVCKGADGIDSYQSVPCAADASQLSHGSYDDSIGKPSWDSTVSAFEARHPDILAHSNLVIMQAALNKVVRPGMSDNQLLSAAYALATAQPTWNGAKTLPVGEPVSVTPLLGRASVAVPTKLGHRSRARAGRQAPALSWQRDQVRDMPGAVMVAPDQALSPYNGHIVQLEPDLPGQPRTRSAAGSAQADIACAQAMHAGWDGAARSYCAMGLNPNGQP